MRSKENFRRTHPGPWRQQQSVSSVRRCDVCKQAVLRKREQERHGWKILRLLPAAGAEDSEEETPSRSLHSHEKEDNDVRRNNRLQEGGNRSADDMLSQAAGLSQQRVTQSGTHHWPTQGVHGYRYFAKGMELALHRPEASKVVHPKVYSALIQRGKETKR